MDTSEVFRKLITKWANDSEEYKAEARRLEAVDRTRHAASIPTLEARALSIDRCILDTEMLTE
jgi:hypothetical protein